MLVGLNKTDCLRGFVGVSGVLCACYIEDKFYARSLLCCVLLRLVNAVPDPKAQFASRIVKI